MSEAERLARLETWKDGHEDRCAERYKDIKDDTQDIKGALTSMSAELKAAVSRIHDRVDGHDGKISGLKIWVLGGCVTLLLTILGYAVTTWGPLSR